VVGAGGRRRPAPPAAGARRRAAGRGMSVAPYPARGTYMITATPTRQTSAPTTS
jgi:hypothetical protein